MAPHQRCWSVRKLETLAISKCESDPITKRIQKIVFSLIVLITHSKALNLIHQVVLRYPLTVCDINGERQRISNSVQACQDRRFAAKMLRYETCEDASLSHLLAPPRRPWKLPRSRD
jgi:hypothetical protein